VVHARRSLTGAVRSSPLASPLTRQIVRASQADAIPGKTGLFGRHRRRQPFTVG
jgi:hypothetical protein